LLIEKVAIGLVFGAALGVVMAQVLPERLAKMCAGKGSGRQLR
jgi:hypothetical protein